MPVDHPEPRLRAPNRTQEVAGSSPASSTFKSPHVRRLIARVHSVHYANRRSIVAPPPAPPYACEMAVCKTCGAENRPGARFCDSCGAPLAAAPSREVRKTVTVFFSDVTGSTALGERVDPETLRRVMSRYFEAARAALERHGGTVEKFIGDAVMAVFGIPQAHEDDALRALRAAVELRESMHVLNAELERDHGVSLEARIGVSTGEVVAGTEERLATGDAVNVAARLEQAAAPGEILVGEQTLR